MRTITDFEEENYGSSGREFTEAYVPNLIHSKAMSSR